MWEINRKITEMEFIQKAFSSIHFNEEKYNYKNVCLTSHNVC